VHTANVTINLNTVDNMRQTIYRISLFLSLLFMTFNYGCKTQAICGMFMPTHEITLGLDSTFRYSKWYFDTDSNSFGHYSEGRYQQIDKNTYILNSCDFNPDSINTANSFLIDSTTKGFRIKVTSDLDREDFEFHHNKLSLIIDNISFDFKTTFIDTIITDKPQSIELKLIIQKDSVIPNSLYDSFKSRPIENIPRNSNFAKIHFPVSGKYYNWYPLTNRILYRQGKRENAYYYLWGDSSIVNLRKE